MFPSVFFPKLGISAWPFTYLTLPIIINTTGQVRYYNKFLLETKLQRVTWNRCCLSLPKLSLTSERRLTKTSIKLCICKDSHNFVFTYKILTHGCTLGLQTFPGNLLENFVFTFKYLERWTPIN